MSIFWDTPIDRALKYLFLTMDFPSVLIRCMFLPLIDNFGSPLDDRYHLEIKGKDHRYLMDMIAETGSYSIK